MHKTKKHNIITAIFATALLTTTVHAADDVLIGLSKGSRIKISLAPEWFDIDGPKSKRNASISIRFVNAEAQCSNLYGRSTTGREHNWSVTIPYGYVVGYATCTTLSAGKKSYAEIRVCDENRRFLQRIAYIRTQINPRVEEELALTECIKTRVPERGNLWSHPETMVRITYPDSVVIGKGETREILRFGGPASRNTKVKLRCMGKQCGSLTVENVAQNMIRPLTLNLRTDETVRIKHNGQTLGEHTVEIQGTIELI